MAETLASAIYTGRIRHRRLAPKAHRLDYRLFMLYIDLDELPDLFTKRRFWSLNRRNLASFWRRDYFKPEVADLKQAILDFASDQLGRPVQGSVRMLTHLRYFGHCFNPVTFYYIFEQGQLSVIVPEINNTPWNERFAYVLPITEAQQDGKLWSFFPDKAFHISPFMSMEQSYRWQFQQPGEQLVANLESYEQDQKIFDATLVLTRQPLNQNNLQRVLVHYPLMTLKVVWGIYYHALQLWLKKVPLYKHPKKGDPL